MARISPPTGAFPGPTETRLTGFSIRADRPGSPAARGLLARHLATMRAQSPPEAVHALDEAGLSGPDVRFVVLWEGDLPLAMGALKRLSDTGASSNPCMWLPRRAGAGPVRPC